MNEKPTAVESLVTTGETTGEKSRIRAAQHILDVFEAVWAGKKGQESLKM